MNRNIKNLAFYQPQRINKYFGSTFYFMMKLEKENLLPLRVWYIRDKLTKIVISEFICKEFSWQYLTTRKENICKGLGLNPDNFELT